MSPTSRRGRPATQSKPAVHAAREQVGRLLSLVPYLHQHGEVRLSQAAADLGVDARQLEKDLRVLFMCGLPGGLPDDLIDVDLDALEDDGIIRIDNADYLARPVRFAPSEAAALVVALRSMSSGADPQSRPLIERTLDKLVAAGAASAAEQIHVADDPDADDRIRPVVQSAIARRRQLEIVYYVPSRDEQTTRVVDPRAISRVGEASYLDAWCHTALSDRSFRLDRILAVTELDSTVGEHGRQTRELTGDWFADGQETIEVTLRLAPDAHWVPEYYRVNGTAPGPDGTLDVTLDVASEAWLRHLLLRLAPDATVIAPAAFAEHVAADVQAALSLYHAGDVR